MDGNEDRMNVCENRDGTCSDCNIGFDDFRTALVCTKCKKYFHAKCENVELRGFHMKKLTWKCKQCETVKTIPRKRLRTEDLDGTDVLLGNDISQTLQYLVQNIKELNNKLDFLIQENTELKEEIKGLKVEKSTRISELDPESSKMLYSTAVRSDKILVVKPKNNQTDINEVKRDLRNKVDPTDIGTGIKMGRTTKSGGLILQCGSEKQIENIQSEIQTKMGENYIVHHPKALQHRIKIVGIGEFEADIPDDDIITKIIKQNNCDKEARLKILRRTKVSKNRFNMVMEIDSKSYESFMKYQKINIGWNRCNIYNDYGIIRCFKCCRYGHQAKECKESKVCSKCAGDHEFKDCVSDVVTCFNCSLSNEKYGLKLKTDHVVWDVVKCDTYKRLEKVQMQKYVK